MQPVQERAVVAAVHGQLGYMNAFEEDRHWALVSGIGIPAHGPSTRSPFSTNRIPAQLRRRDRLER